MTTPKAFQQATVAAACEVLSRKSGKPRFLVADEVGLGKTVVAQQVIANLVRYKRRPLVVYYVSSSLTIAAQNGSKLVEAVSEGTDPKSALCTADRLSMLPFAPGPTHPRAHLYTLTPDTSLPNRRGRRRDGRKDERALIAVLLEQCWPGLDENFFRIFPRQASRHWVAACENAEYKLSRLQEHRGIGLTLLRSLFKNKLRARLGLADRQHVPQVLLERANQDALDLIAILRTALVECTFELEGFQPDLVIFDEFQRFRDLVKPTMGLDGKTGEMPGPVLARLRGDAGKAVPLLLLSATPYSLYNHRDEETLFGSHHDQLLELLCFLYGDGKQGLEQAQLAQKLFKDFGSQLRGGETLNYASVEHASSAIEQHLTQIMSRTERALALQHSESNNSKKSPEPIEVTTEPGDWRIFRHLSERFPERYRSSAITYWRSVPLPMQTMGSSYIAWDKANKSRRPPSTRPFTLLAEHVNQHKKVHWPHGKLRKLVDHIDPNTLCLPWLPPSLPWWPLRGGWLSYKAEQGKVLLFSRFRATPKAVAAALSHEARVKAAQMGNMPESGTTSLRLNIDRMPIFGLFYPSFWLTQCVDPLSAAGKSPGKVRKTVREQLKKILKEHHVKVTQSKGVRREFWRLMAALDGYFDPKRPNWTEVTLEQRDVVQAWEQAATEPVEALTGGELNLLADYALGAPGIVLARSLRRHYKADHSTDFGRNELSANDRLQLIQFSLNSWRNYFDNAVFVASLRKRKGQYPESLRQAVIDGNLEAALDEQLWFMAPDGMTNCQAVLTDLAAALGIRGGRVAIHHPDNKQVMVHCQCDVAMPLAQELEASTGEGEARPPRADQIRKAFNSPFWPFVLTTTSVGQEGLDFHPWCKTLLHWDLPGNPVDLEQREGRIQRYGGLAVRRCIAADHGSSVLTNLTQGESPWRALAKAMDNEPTEDGTGLEPWWHYPGGEVKSFFFHLPASEEAWQLELLKQQRAVYRLALGQQHQEDFVRMVSTRDPETLQRLSALTPNLSAWKQKKNRE